MTPIAVNRLRGCRGLLNPTHNEMPLVDVVVASLAVTLMT